MLLKNITSFLFVLYFQFSNSAIGQNATERIRLNQIGFYPNAQKIAVVNGVVSSPDFYITTTNLRDTVFKGLLSAEKQSIYSSSVCRIADFSGLKKMGSFVLNIPQVGQSYTFSIANDVHRTAAIASLKGYYFQRCSMPLEFSFAGKWQRSSGHPDTSVFIHSSAASKDRPTGTKISTPGGWYDAGDYNKYIVNSGISMGTLFSAYEDFPEFFKSLLTNIPESGNGIPDILNECLYNLRWMFTMQDPADGGVYNKCTNASFDGMVMPGVTTKPRYVVQKGTAATLDFTAVMAQASRIFSRYKKRLPGLSDSCMNAAIKGWQWSEKFPDLNYDQNLINKTLEPKITTGGYGDHNFQDEWFWAASELYITTKEKLYFKMISNNYAIAFSIPAWNNVFMSGIYSLIRNRDLLPKESIKMIHDISNHLLQFSDSLINNSKSAFNTIIGQSKKDFIWGSNAVAANQSIVLLNAFQYSANNKYLNAALSNLDYILGRNATGFCFLTGNGSKSTMHPHHRQSISDGVAEPVPGLLAGGPNPGRQDGANYEFIEPETAYTDKSEAYACNEIAINWNAPLVYLVSAFEALQKLF